MLLCAIRIVFPVLCEQASTFIFKLPSGEVAVREPETTSDVVQAPQVKNVTVI